MTFAKSFTIVGSFTVLSKILGMVREVVMASLVGAGWLKDALVIASSLPSLLRRILAEGAFSAVFIPNYSQMLVSKDAAATKAYAREILSFLFFLLIGIVIIMEIFTPQIVAVISPGNVSSPKFGELVTYSRICLPFLLFIFLNSFYSGILNSHGKFAAMASSPVVGNIAIITIMIAPVMVFNITPDYGYLICGAVLACGVVQAIWVFIPAYRMGLAPSLHMPRLTKGVTKTFKKLASVAAAYGIAQLNALIARGIASFLGAGAISYLYYAEKLYLMPISVIGAAIASSLLPLITKSIHIGDKVEANRLQISGINLSLFLGLPTSMALFVIAPEIIQMIFEHGRFNHGDTIATAAALRGYVIGVPAYLAIKVFSTSFYARKITTPPLIAAAIAIVCEVGLSLALIGEFAHVGIAYASSTAAIASAVFLGIQLYKRKMLILKSENYTYFMKLIISSCLLLIPLIIMKSAMAKVLGGSTILKVAATIFCVGVCWLIFVIVGYFLGIVDLTLFNKRAKS